MINFLCKIDFHDWEKSIETFIWYNASVWNGWEKGCKTLVSYNSDNTADIHNHPKWKVCLRCGKYINFEKQYEKQSEKRYMRIKKAIELEKCKKGNK